MNEQTRTAGQLQAALLVLNSVAPEYLNEEARKHWLAGTNDIRRALNLQADAIDSQTNLERQGR